MLMIAQIVHTVMPMHTRKVFLLILSLLILRQAFAIPCPVGKYSTDGATNCQECDAGYYAAFEGTNVCLFCTCLDVNSCLQLSRREFMSALVST